MKSMIFYLEDDENINALIGATLESNGFDSHGFLYAEDFLKQIETEIPDLIVLDLMLEGISGFEILKILKEKPHFMNIPVIIVSALSSEQDIIQGLDMGASDYITKPFRLREFISRVNANLKKNLIVAPRVLKIRDLILNLDEHKCYVYGHRVELTNIEFNIISILMINSPIVVTRAKILKDIWNFDAETETRTLDMHIKTLRKKIEQFTPEQYIETVRGIGYVINDEKLAG